MIKLTLAFFVLLLVYGFVNAIKSSSFLPLKYPTTLITISPESNEIENELQHFIVKKVIDTLKQKKPKKPQFDEPILIKNTPNTDRSLCSSPPLFEEMVTTEFAGYTLQYPCTVIDKGSVRSYFDRNKKPYSLYTLYLYTSIDGEKETIWSTKFREYNSGKVGLSLALRNIPSNKKNKTSNFSPFNMKKVPINPINSLSFHRDGYRVVGEIIDELDATNKPPSITCSIKPTTEIDEVFTLLDSPKQKNIRCSFGWMLTNDIRVSSFPNSIDINLAYHFKDIFNIVNKDLTEAIIYPEPIQISL